MMVYDCCYYLLGEVIIALVSGEDKGGDSVWAGYCRRYTSTNCGIELVNK